ncbi:MAG TPA: hypothetical protein PLD45_09330 [Spirochaetales bacterium]|nr:hypothetical protein [Spirochaetales bacterium]
MEEDRHREVSGFSNHEIQIERKEKRKQIQTRTMQKQKKYRKKQIVAGHAVFIAGKSRKHETKAEFFNKWRHQNSFPDHRERWWRIPASSEPDFYYGGNSHRDEKKHSPGDYLYVELEYGANLMPEGYNTRSQ